MTSTATLPPPLSDMPSVTTLERLLVGLHQPMQRGVPSPPPPGGLLDLTALVDQPDAAPRTASPPSPPSLSWSAGTRRTVLGGPTTAALGVALATAAGLAARLAAAGELSLP